MLGLFASIYATDAVLREKLKSREESAFLYLYRHYYRASENLITRNGGTREQALQVHQFGVVLTYEKIINDALVESCPAHLYLFSVVRKLWQNQSNIPTTEWIETQAFIELPDEDIIYDLTENINEYSKGIEQLNEVQRNVLIGYYYEKQNMTTLNGLYKIGTTEQAKELKYKSIRQLLEYIAGLSLVGLLEH